MDISKFLRQVYSLHIYNVHSIIRFTAEEKAKRPQLCHMPFGFGPRSCIAMRLALLEAKIALIELLKRYTLTRAPETEVCIHAMVTSTAYEYYLML